MIAQPPVQTPMFGASIPVLAWLNWFQSLVGCLTGSITTVVLNPAVVAAGALAEQAFPQPGLKSAMAVLVQPAAGAAQAAGIAIVGARIAAVAGAATLFVTFLNIGAAPAAPYAGQHAVVVFR